MCESRIVSFWTRHHGVGACRVHTLDACISVLWIYTNKLQPVVFVRESIFNVA